MNLVNMFDLQAFKATSGLNRIALLLLLLFPIGAISIRHWVSSIFSILTCLAILRLKELLRNPGFSGLEKALLWLMTLFFFSYVISSLVNGWDEESWRILGKEFRFLAFIPLYVYLRSLPGALKVFGLGCVVAIPINLAVVVFQFWWFGLDRPMVGVYGSLFSGPVTVLMLIPAALYLRSSPQLQSKEFVIFTLTIIAAAVAVQMSRSAVVGLVIWAASYYIWMGKSGRRFAAYFALLLLAALAITLQIDTVKLPNFATGIAEFRDYFSHQPAAIGSADPNAQTSVGARLELLKATKLIFLDYPLWGIGGYNFQHVINHYVDAGLIAAELRNAAHPHNVLAEVLVSKGLVGLLIFIGMFWAAFALFHASRLVGADKIHLYGNTYLFVIVSMMMTEAAMVIKGNFIAIFLLFLALFLAESRHR